MACTCNCTCSRTINLTLNVDKSVEDLKRDLAEFERRTGIHLALKNRAN